MDYPYLPSLHEVRTLADNWCHDNLGEDHYSEGDAVYNWACSAYLAGYKQACQDVKDNLA